VPNASRNLIELPDVCRTVPVRIVRTVTNNAPWPQVDCGLSSRGNLDRV
jgi:hypothetical protein